MEYTKIRDKAQLENMLETQDRANVEIAGRCTTFYHGGSAPHFCGKIEFGRDEMNLIVEQYSDRMMPLEAAVLKLAAKTGLIVFIRGQIRKNFGAYVIDVSEVKLKFNGDYEITTGDYEKATHPF